MTDELQSPTEHEMIEALIKRISLPREWGASYLGISAGLDHKPCSDWIEIRLSNGELWKLTCLPVPEGRVL